VTSSKNTLNNKNSLSVPIVFAASDVTAVPFQKLRRGSAAGREEGQTRQESFKHDRKYRCLLQPRGARGDARISCRIKSGQHLVCGGVASSGCLL